MTKNGSQKKNSKAKCQTTHKQTQTKQKSNNANETDTSQFLHFLNPCNINIIFVVSVSFNSFNFNTYLIPI